MVDSKFSVLLWSKALVLDLDQAEQLLPLFDAANFWPYPQFPSFRFRNTARLNNARYQTRLRYKTRKISEITACISPLIIEINHTNTQETSRLCNTPILPKFPLPTSWLHPHKDDFIFVFTGYPAKLFPFLFFIEFSTSSGYRNFIMGIFQQPFLCRF